MVESFVIREVFVAMNDATIRNEPEEDPPMELRPIGNESCDPCQSPRGTRIIRSDELLQGQRELFIVHDGAIYRLLRTRNNKLILQK